MSNKTYNDIKKALPDIDSEKVETISNTLDEILNIKKIFEMDEGKVFMQVLKDNCSIALRKAIIEARNTEPDKVLIHILNYAANAELLSKFRDVSLEKEIRSQLDEAVKEEYTYI